MYYIFHYFENIHMKDFRYGKQQIPERVIHLGKSARSPLVVLPQTKIIPSIYNQNTCLKQPNALQFIPVNKPPFKILKQTIGLPFQIRVPTNDIRFLVSQIEELKQKCEKLENQQKSSKDDSIIYEQIAKSAKLIQQQFSNLLCEKNKDITESSSEQKRENIEQDYAKAIRLLQQKQQKINELQLKNKELQEKLIEKQKQLKELKLENQKMKQRQNE